MSESSVLESLPDRSMKRSEIEKIGDGDAVEWVEPLTTGTNERRNMVDAWAIQSSGTVHVLLYQLDGWVSKDSFDAEGLSDDEKRERGLEILGS